MRHRWKRIRQLCATVFAREIPAEQEINTKIREAVSEGIDMFDGGVLLYIVCYDEAMTEEQLVENGLDFTDYRYISATRDKPIFSIMPVMYSMTRRMK